jgi:hypothetical protein
MSLTFVKQFFEQLVRLAPTTTPDQLTRQALVATHEASVNGFGYSSTYITSLQTAFNTIEISQDPNLDTKRAKIDVMLNAMGLRVSSTPSPEINLKAIDGKAQLINTLQNMPIGCFTVRAILEEANHKGEKHGHTVVVIKDSHNNPFYYYDPNYGLREVDVHNLALELKNIYKEFDTNSVRFYPTAPVDQNDSQETNPAQQLERQIVPVLNQLGKVRHPDAQHMPALKTLIEGIREARFRNKFATVLDQNNAASQRTLSRTVGKQIPVTRWEKRLDTLATRWLKQITPQAIELGILGSAINKADAVLHLFNASPAQRLQLLNRLNQLDQLLRQNAAQFIGQPSYSSIECPIEFIAGAAEDDWIKMHHILNVMSTNLPMTRKIPERQATVADLMLSIRDLAGATIYFPFRTQQSVNHQENTLNEFNVWIASQTF